MNQTPIRPALNPSPAPRPLVTQGEWLIRNATSEEMPLLISWAAEEGWNPGLHDADSFFNTDQHGFFLGVLNGTPIGSISAVRYGEDFGFIGFYMVRPEYRGLGFGLQLWNTALRFLDGRIIGLDGVLAQEENYRASGFRLAHRSSRYEGKAFRLINAEQEDEEVTLLRGFPFSEVLNYDEPFFPVSRPRFLKNWLQQSSHIALGLRRRGALSGFGVMRPCQHGFKIGPLVADDITGAEALISSLSSHVPNETVIYLDVPKANPSALAMARSLGMRSIFETARMYTGHAPTNTSLTRCFGVASFELG